MHANIVKAPTREVYVPAPARPTLVTEEPKPSRLPRKLAVAPASAVFRTIPWSGEPRAEAEVEAAVATTPTRRAVIPAHVKARAMFAQVRWTGEAAGAPTQTQRRYAVQNVFEEFGWE